MSYTLENNESLHLEGSICELSYETAQNQNGEQLYLQPEEDGTLEHLELFEALLQQKADQDQFEAKMISDRELHRNRPEAQLSCVCPGQPPAAASYHHAKKEKKISKQRKGSEATHKKSENGQKHRKNSLKLHPLFKLKQQQNEAIQQNICSHHSLEKTEPSRFILNSLSLAEDTQGSDPFFGQLGHDFGEPQPQGSLDLGKEASDYECYLNLS